MTDWLGRLGTAAWLVVGAVSLLVVLATGLAVAGFLAGGPADPGGSAPAVDHEDPPAEVAADALAALRYRDHTREWWLAGRNHSDGSRMRGVVSRFAVDHSARRIELASWGTRTLGLENGSVTPDQPPDHVLFGNRLSYRWQRGGHGDWQRIHRRGVTYDRTAFLPTADPAAVRAANVTVVADNASALVVRTTDPAALAAFETLHRYRANATATVVVTKGSDPHVSRVTLRNRTGPAVRSETFVVRDVGTTSAERPDPAPPVSASEVAARVAVGLERLFG